MRLLQDFWCGLVQRRPAKSPKRAGARRATHRFAFQTLEKRRVLDAASFGLIGLTDYYNNPSFSELNGSPYRIAVIDSGIYQAHPVFDSDPQDGIIGPDRLSIRLHG
jgi:hypothetical protein